MYEETTTQLLNTLKLNETFRNERFVCIEECNNADGSFIISSIIKDQIEKDCNVVLIMCHNSTGHFQSISQKLGYNLMSLKDSNRVFLLDVFEKIVSEDFLSGEEPLRQIYLETREKINSWNDGRNVCIVVENVGNILMINMKNVFNFIQYLRGIIHKKKNSLCVCSVHNFLGDADFNAFTTSVKHMADCVVTLKDLATGRAHEVTGHLSVSTRDENFTKHSLEYHYLLQDKTIHVFTPGSNEHLFRR